MCETKEKKYHHNTAIAAGFDSIDGSLYFIAKTPQAEAKGTNMLIMEPEETKSCH